MLSWWEEGLVLLKTYLPWATAEQSIMRSVLQPVPFYSPCLWVFLLTAGLLDRKHPWEVDTRGETLLSQRSHHPGGEQEGPEERWAHTQGTGQDEAGITAFAGQWAGGGGVIRHRRTKLHFSPSVCAVASELLMLFMTCKYYSRRCQQNTKGCGELPQAKFANDICEQRSHADCERWHHHVLQWMSLTNCRWIHSCRDVTSVQEWAAKETILWPQTWLNQLQTG